MALNSTCVLRRSAGRLPVESWGPATRAAQHPARSVLLVACCVCCLLHVATACCNVGADDCQWKVWDLRHAQRKPVFTCKPVAMGVTAVRIRSTAPSLAIPLGHPSRSRTHGRGTRLRPRTDGRCQTQLAPHGEHCMRDGPLLSWRCGTPSMLHVACCMLSVVRCPRSHSTFIARCCG